MTSATPMHSEKTAALAVHWETKVDGQSIEETRLSWNHRYPEWEYPNLARNFGLVGAVLVEAKSETYH